jgi:hypothetical protein
MLSTTGPTDRSVGRVELRDVENERIFFVSSGIGSFDTLFNALAQKFERAPSVRKISARYEPQKEPRDEVAQVSAEIQIEMNGAIHRGSACTEDLLLSTATAYLNTLCEAVGKCQTGRS